MRTIIAALQTQINSVFFQNIPKSCQPMPPTPSAVSVFDPDLTDRTAVARQLDLQITKRKCRRMCIARVN